MGEKLIRGRPVLVGVDPANPDPDAVAFAAGVAEAAGSELRVVVATCDRLTDVAAARVGVDTALLHRALRERAESAVREALPDQLLGHPLGDLLRVEIGRPEHLLQRAAEREGAGLVILAGRRHAGLSGWFRRGTAHALLRALETPVLVTGPGVLDLARVLVAVDLSTAALPTMAMAVEIADLLGLELEALHVVDLGPLESDPSQAAAATAYVRSSTRMAEEELWPRLPDSAGRQVTSGHPADAITSAAETGAPALVVLGTHGYGWLNRWLLGSTTERVLERLPASLAIVPTFRFQEEGGPGRSH